MAVMAGVDGIVKFGTNQIGYIDTWSITRTQNTGETSQLGKRDQEYIPTNRNWSGSLSGSFDYADAAQKSIIDQLIGDGVGTVLAAAFVTNSELTLSGSIIVTSVAIGASHGDKITLSINFQGTGKLSAAAA